MKRYLLTGLLLGTLLSNQIAAHAEEQTTPTIQDFPALTTWITDNLKCSGEFVTEVQDNQFLDQIKKLGVTMKDIESDGPPSGTWVLPQKIKIYGFDADTISYWGDSGSEFAIEVHATPEQLKKAMKAHALPDMIKKDGYYAGIQTEKPTTDNPYPNLIYIAATDNKDISMVGCRTYDY
jgi:hypothetical protein